MTEDLPDFLSDAPASMPAAEAAPEVAQEAALAPPAAPVAQPAPVAAPAAPLAPEPVSDAAQAAAMQVPLATFLDMRDRANKHELEAKQLREWRQQQEAAARRQPPPSREEDPEGYEAYRENQYGQQLYSMKMTSSRRFAELSHGPDVVKTAFDWGAARCDQDPFFNEKVRASEDPIGFVVTEWKREQVASKVDPTDFEDYLAWKAAKGADPANPQPSSPAAPNAPPARPQAPTRSIASAPSAGASADPRVPGSEETFNRMFGS